MIISQIEPLFNGRSPATGVKKGEKLANKRIYLHSDNFRIMSSVVFTKRRNQDIALNRKISLPLLLLNFHSKLMISLTC